MFRYRTCAILAISLMLTAAGPSPLPVNPPAVVTFEVTSQARQYAPGPNRGEPIDFEVHALGGDLKNAVDYDRKTTPYNVTVRGREAYAMFRQLGGNDLLHIVVRPTGRKSCQATARLSFVVVRGDSCGGSTMRPE